MVILVEGSLEKLILMILMIIIVMGMIDFLGTMEGIWVVIKNFLGKMEEIWVLIKNFFFIILFWVEV